MVNIEGFETSMHVEAGFDHRDEPGDQRGATGAKLVLTLKGPQGAIVAFINTGWMRRPLKSAGVVRGIKQPRRDRPGVDRGVIDIYPSGGYVASHCATPHEGEEDSAYGPCSLLGTDVCYGTTGYTTADEILDLLVEEGSDAAFARMAEIYQSWIVEATPSALVPAR